MSRLLDELGDQVSRAPIVRMRCNLCGESFDHEDIGPRPVMCPTCDMYNDPTPKEPEYIRSIKR